jgi:uncharacterized membrane protein YbhN (UPF0104 family)
LDAALISGWRFKALLASVLVAAAGYLLVSLASGWDAFVHAVVRIGAPGIAAALLMSCLNYGLRFLRWQSYLRVLGHRLPWRAHLRIYLSGFALTTTPGKAGEALRSVFLKPLGVDYHDSLAALFSERLSDLIAVLLLALAGLSLYPRLRGAVLLGFALIAVGLVLLARGVGLAWLERRGERLGGRLGALLSHVARLLLQARRCHGPRLVLAATALGVLAWAAEAVAFSWITHWLGIDLSLRYAVFVYAVSMLAGALSVLPGGLGGAEAAMVALLMFQKASLADAAAATVLIRMATLWFAVGLGLLALSAQQRRGLEP